MRHTPYSRALLLLALVPALAGLVLGNAALLLLAGAVLFVLVRARDDPPTDGAVELELPKERVQRSTPLTARLRCRFGQGPFVGLAHQDLPDAFVLSAGSNLHLAAPGQSCTFELDIASPKRGAWTLDPPTLDLVHPLGLAPAHRLAQGEETSLTVEPVVRPLKTVKGLRAISKDRPGEDPATRGPSSTDFRELRDYNRGDPLKFVNWKATAKRSTRDLNLVVNEYEPEARKNVWFFLDLHRDLEVGTTLHTALEDAIDITLALVDHYTARGHRVGGATYNGQTPHLFYPDTGSRQELIIARALARAAPGDQREGLPAAVERSKGFLARERPLVFVVTRPDTGTDALVQGARRIHKHTATTRRAHPVTVLVPEPAMGTTPDALARALSSLEATRALSQSGSSLLRVHRLQEGAKGLERALAKGVLAR